jgi:hypothetical protein
LEVVDGTDVSEKGPDPLLWQATAATSDSSIAAEMRIVSKE